MFNILIVRPGFSHETLYFSSTVEAIRWANHLKRVDSTVDTIVYSWI